MPPIVVVLLLLTTPTVLADSSPSTTSPQNNIPDIVFTNRNNQTDKYSKQHKYIDGSMEPVYSVAKQIINIFVGQRIPDGKKLKKNMFIVMYIDFLIIDINYICPTVVKKSKIKMISGILSS